MIDGRERQVVNSEVREVLNYFGKCPLCGYPARASSITAEFSDGVVETQFVATCGLPCGWNGPVPANAMTGTVAVLEGGGKIVQQRRPTAEQRDPVLKSSEH